MATTDDELRQRAEAATPGPWLVERDYPSPDVHDAKGNVIATTMHSDLSRQEDGANAAFIAAANPAAVLALLDRVAKAEAGWQPIETTREGRVHYAEGRVYITLGGVEHGMPAAEAKSLMHAIEWCAGSRTGWQPIETAPHDQWVLVYAAPAHGLPGFVCAALCTREGGWCVDELRHATHWRPLPAVPEMTP